MVAGIHLPFSWFYTYAVRKELLTFTVWGEKEKREKGMCVHVLDVPLSDTFEFPENVFLRTSVSQSQQRVNNITSDH